MKEDYDGAEPSGNSVATAVLLRLAHITGDEKFAARAEAILRAFAPKLEEQPSQAPQMLVALGDWLSEPAQVVIRCSSIDDRVRAFLLERRRRFEPYSVTAVVSDDAVEALRRVAPFLASLDRTNDAIVYECANFVCQLPRALGDPSRQSGLRRKRARRARRLVNLAPLDAASIQLYGVHESLHRKGEERVNRRHFLVSSAAAVGAAPALCPARMTRSELPVSGCAGGAAATSMRSNMPNVEIVAFCDIDENILNKRLQEIEQTGKKRPASNVDVRKLLEDKNIDAISIATPNHSHSLQTIWACQAGKDVYVEKPCSHNMFEAKQMVAAARKYNRMVQQGSQQPLRQRHCRKPCRKMRDGFIGDVYMARGLCFKWRDTIGHKPVEPVPAGVHYDLWLGRRPSMRSRATVSITTGTGSGITAMATSATRGSMKWTSPAGAWASGIPRKSAAIGGHFMFNDDQETPNTLNCQLRVQRQRQEEDDGIRSPPLDVEPRGRHRRTGKKKDPNTIGNLFYGSKGYMAIDEDYRNTQTWMGKEQRARAAGEAAGGNHFGELHHRRPQPQPRRTERGNRGRRHLHRARAPGEHLLPPGARTEFRSRNL